MNTPFKINISLKIFLGYFLLVGLAAWFVLTVFVDEVKPGVRQAMEDSLVDTANVLAELAASDVKSHKIQDGNFAQSLARYQTRRQSANIWGVKKHAGDYRVYITDAKGLVIYDSSGLAVGENYARWNDVYLTLRGEYGVRSSPVVPGDVTHDTVMYVAAPIKDGRRIIGSLTVAKPNRTLLPFIERAQYKMIKWGALLLVLSLIIGTLFTWRFTKKIRKLREYAIQVADGQKAIAPTSSNDELAELAIAMQTMRNELDGKQYVQDSVEHLTHELKSPISAIQGAVELISPQMPAATQAHFLDQIKAQLLRIQTIIHNILGLAALEHQQQIVKLSEVNVATMISTQVHLLEAKAASRDIEFLTMAPPDVYIQVEPFLLGQAIYNLLENAIDFSPNKSKIEITTLLTKTDITIAVRDRGTGIPDYALDKIFNKFYSLPRPTYSGSAGQKSTGLGLNFVQEIIHLHQGRLAISNHPHGGVLATITLSTR